MEHPLWFWNHHFFFISQRKMSKLQKKRFIFHCWFSTMLFFIFLGFGFFVFGIFTFCHSVFLSIFQWPVFLINIISLSFSYSWDWYLYSWFETNNIYCFEKRPYWRRRGRSGSCCAIFERNVYRCYGDAIDERRWNRWEKVEQEGKERKRRQRNFVVCYWRSTQILDRNCVLFVQHFIWRHF